MSSLADDIVAVAVRVLLQPDPLQKARLTKEAADSWHRGDLSWQQNNVVVLLEPPPRPARNQQVRSPARLTTAARSTSSNHVQSQLWQIQAALYWN